VQNKRQPGSRALEPAAREGARHKTVREALHIQLRRPQGVVVDIKCVDVSVQKQAGVM
jgi:hypothetical protein